MEELSSALTLALMLISVFVMTGILNTIKKTRQAQGGQRQAVKPAQRPAPAKQPAHPNTAPVYDDFSASAFPREHDSDAHGWDSLSEFHEGEDPCHDDMEPVSPLPTEQAEPSSDLNAKELVRGFVIGEVLARRRPRPYSR
ncbi:MAG: hypothetical protein IKR85_06410 [Clostridia bacterium]|nr:hypothetical protein [Clostridia bacterium]